MIGLTCMALDEEMICRQARVAVLTVQRRRQTSSCVRTSKHAYSEVQYSLGVDLSPQGGKRAESELKHSCRLTSLPAFLCQGYHCHQLHPQLRAAAAGPL